jgi:hypothetical protein
MIHFKYFPRIEYSDNHAVNLLVRGKVRDYVKSQNALYYQYTIADGDRADVIATKYYGNPDYTWIIYYANNIFHPVHDWPKKTDEFYFYLMSKYGSVSKTKSLSEKPHHYLLDDTYVIDETTFLDNSIPASRKRAVSVYEHEFNLNEAKRNIVIVDAFYLRQISNEFKNLFR